MARRRPVLASLARVAPSAADPLAAFSAAGRYGGTYRAFWARPSYGFALAGSGAAAVLTAGVARPVDQLRRTCRDLLDGAVVEGPAARGVGPLFLGGCRFDPAAPPSGLWSAFPDGLLVLPRILVTRSQGQCWFTLNVLADQATDPEAAVDETLAELTALMAGPRAASRQPPVDRETEEPTEDWAGGVGRALAAIARGEMTKVVLARRRTLYARGEFSVDATLEHLAAAYPECATFALDLGGAVFLGASPEALVHLSDGVLSLSCLAGSAARGATTEEDDWLARELLASAKERREHAAVVAQVTAALGQTCADLSWDATPRVVKLATVQHLATLVTGRPPGSADILSLVEALHPTPAVGGVPTGKALEVIRSQEGDRGWYAAPVGWVDQRGEGEFNVGIRSALLRGDEATLFAGSGIVEGSEPERELRETELKFQPLLRALRQA